MNVSDEDWERALNCAQTVMEGYHRKLQVSTEAGRRAALDDSMQHAFGLLSLRVGAQRALEPLSLQAVREDERLACWKIADRERTALKNADPTKAAWLVAFDIANAIKMRGTALTSTECGDKK